MNKINIDKFLYKLTVIYSLVAVNFSILSSLFVSVPKDDYITSFFEIYINSVIQSIDTGLTFFVKFITPVMFMIIAFRLFTVDDQNTSLRLKTIWLNVGMILTALFLLRNYYFL